MRVRMFLLAAILAVGCKRSTPDASRTSLRFLPATAETALRVDVARAKTWSGWQKTSDAAFRSIAKPIEAVKTACGFDLIADASSVVFAQRTGDATIVIAGLPKDKTTVCAGKLGTAVPGLGVVADGERFAITVGGKSAASGAVLANGDVVIVSRGVAGIAPAAWTTVVASGSGATPPWWAELDQTQPLALRLQSPDRTATGDAQLGDPLVLHATVIAATPALAATDLGRAKAIVEFLTKAEAGTGRLEPKGTTIFADFTATGPQIEKLLAAGLSMLGADQPMPEAPTGLATSPIECSTLAPAVATYLATSVAAMPPEQAAQIQGMLAKIIPALQKAYLDSCTTGAWAPAAIHCHVDSAANVPRFEKCRLVLTAEQRTKFDELVKAALTAP